MPLFGKADEAKNHFKESERYSHPKKKEFDLEAAIRHLEEAAILKPDNEQYRQKLEEIREIQKRSSLKFMMQAQNPRAVTLPDGEPGVVVSGIIQQGTIREGDEVKLAGGMGKVFDVVSAIKGADSGVAGQHIDLAIATKQRVENRAIIEGA